MSARDAESGSSTYKGGSGSAGGVGNGGLGGGMGGGGNWGMGGTNRGGAARNGGYAAGRTGLTTGNTMFGGMAFGRPGGMAMNPGAFGMRPQAPVQQGPMNRATVPGLLGNPVPASAVPNERILAVEDVPPASYVPNVFNQNYLNSIVDFRNAMKNQYGWGNAVPGPGPMTPSTFNPYSALETYKSPYGPESLSMVGNPGIGINQYSKENIQANKNFGYDPGYRADANMMTKAGNAQKSNRGWGGWNSGWN